MKDRGIQKGLEKKDFSNETLSPPIKILFRFLNGSEKKSNIFIFHNVKTFW